ncbi:MAG: histidinol-phosphate transaminase [Gammaproteobacteria bacterium]|nr:histidinol-phosphate transaminase [Gammaproteobacteria bacterium]
MPGDFFTLPHQGIQTLIPYQPGKSIESLAQELGLKDIIKLASNENPLGCSTAVHLALSQLKAAQIASYPSPRHHPLYARLSEHVGLPSNQLLLSNGSDALFSLLMLTFALHTQKNMVTHDYAFNAYTIQAQALGIPTRIAATNSDFTVNIEAILALCDHNTALIFIANPNNPTGLPIHTEQVKQLLTGLPENTLLVLDEAYIEYTHPEENTIEWLSHHPQLILLRTFSKIYGLAGLRLGYAMAHPDIIELLQRAQLPFTVNQAAMAAGLAALNDQAFMQQSRLQTQQGMIELKQGLLALSLTPIPSVANFITVDCHQPALAIYEALLHEGIIVRPLHPYGLANHLRITIGTTQQIKRLLKALSLILKHPNQESPCQPSL